MKLRRRHARPARAQIGDGTDDALATDHLVARRQPVERQIEQAHHEPGVAAMTDEVDDRR